ncbi:hypothetical protein [Haladaptatus sp. CMAA 1911]|uniref:hypothetical protein n=1 Tax=unclassified Haladaptatus TaxID=2622732 RepID=UPI003753FECE
MTRQTRRTFLATAGAVGFAGCSSVADKTPFPADESERETRKGGRTDVPVADDFEVLDEWHAVSRQGTLSKSTDDAYYGSHSFRSLRRKSLKNRPPPQSLNASRTNRQP